MSPHQFHAASRRRFLLGVPEKALLPKNIGCQNALLTCNHLVAHYPAHG
jgi:hypothetical protein